MEDEIFLKSPLKIYMCLNIVLFPFDIEFEM